MRNPDRIPEVLKELEKFWEQVPDWRLGQVVSNFSYELTGNNDPFYIEDEALLTLLKNKNKNLWYILDFLLKLVYNSYRLKRGGI